MRRRLVEARPARLLLAAALLHVAAACSVFAAARLNLTPGAFDEQGAFIFDSISYREEALALARALTEQGFSAWLSARGELHAKAYSLSYAIFGHALGHSILGAEPLNLLLYLAILALVYRIGVVAFDGRAGLIAAALVALWPSFLLHTTQTLKDPLFILCLLVVLLVAAQWLSETLTLLRGGLLAAGLAAPIYLIARVKSNMWETLASVVFLAVTLLLIRLFRERQVAAGNLLSAALALTFLFAVPVRSTSVHARDRRAMEAADARGEQNVVWRRVGARVASRRAHFAAVYRGHGSNIDEDVAFHNTAQLFSHLPRAALVGTFAPFPTMWLERGARAGQSGRILGGIETLLFYLAALLAAAGVWAGRRNFVTWLLLLVTLVNTVALGLVVTNVGALFRLRYAFWMLLLILAAHGATRLSTLRPWRLWTKRFFLRRDAEAQKRTDDLRARLVRL